MYSDLECGICYRTYNTGRRCPRELRCKHSFCESCLLAMMSRPGEGRPGAAIVCPLCRHTTDTAGEEGSTGLRVDEGALELMLAAGVLERDEPAEAEEEGPEPGEEATPARSAAEGGGGSSSRRGSLRRTWRKVWRAIVGKRERPTVEEDCMNSDDMRDLAMMACYMF